MDETKIRKVYDAFISGSDQVWNLRCMNNDMSYLLNFVRDNKKKYSYAASLGYVMEDDYSNKEYQRLISEFKYKSIREKRGIESVNRLLGGSDPTIGQHIDPTFLLGVDEWKKVACDVKTDSKYILVYSLTMPPKMIEYAKKLSKETGLGLKIITLNNLYSLTAGENVVIASPDEFLGYIDKAEYVITNSFHGTAFSIIFNKRFKVLLNRNPQHDNGRLLDLLSSLDIDSVLINDDSNDFLFEEINYEEVNKRIEANKQQSVSYLKSIIGDNNEATFGQN